MATCGFTLVIITSRCKAPRKNSSSLKPAGTPINSTDTTSDGTEAADLIRSN